MTRREKMTGTIALAALAVLAVAGFADGTYERDAGTYTPDATTYARTAAVNQGLNIAAIGAAVTEHGYWSPEFPDWTSGTAYYFDPSAGTGGDGSRESPWRDWSTDKWRFFAVDAPGDICVLMDGHHGDDIALSNDQSGWNAVVAENRHRATIGSLTTSGTYWLFQGIKFERKRSDFADPGYDAPDSLDWFDSSPGLLTLNAADRIVVLDCLFQAEESLVDTFEWWNEHVPDGIAYGSNPNRRLRVENCEFRHLNYAAKAGVVNNSNWVGNYMHDVAGDMIQHGHCDSVYVRGNFFHDIYAVNNNHNGINQFWMTDQGTYHDFYYGHNRFLESIRPGRVLWMDGGPDVNIAGANGPYYSSGNSTYGHGLLERITIENNVHVGGGWNFTWLKNCDDVTIVNNTAVPYWSHSSQHPEPGTALGHPLIKVTLDGFEPDNWIVANNVLAGTGFASIDPDAVDGITVTGNWFAGVEGDSAKDYSGAGFVDWWMDNEGGAANLLDLRPASASSPLVDAANAVHAPVIDFAGVSRVAHGDPDIGAHERESREGLPGISTIGFAMTGHKLPADTTGWDHRVRARDFAFMNIDMGDTNGADQGDEVWNDGVTAWGTWPLQLSWHADYAFDLKADHVATTGDNQKPIYAFVSFGPASVVPRDSVVSAKLYLNVYENWNNAFPDTGLTIIGNVEPVLEEWIPYGSQESCYRFAYDESGSEVAWSKHPSQWTISGIGDTGHQYGVGTKAGQDVCDVTEQMNEILAAGMDYIVFGLSFTDNNGGAAYGKLSDPVTDDESAMYLVVEFK